MIFTEPRFLLFFLAVFACAWALRRDLSRKLVLLAASWAFYACWDWRFLGLILASTLVDWIAGARIAATSSRGTRRTWLGVSLAANLGLLFFFKYLGFFVDSAVRLLEAVGFQAHAPILAIVLPVGISFYTFQTLSYTIDIYLGRLEPRRSLVDFALFVAFFPQLVAGPIVRASEFLPQLDRRPRFSDVRVRAHLLLFLAGYFKKACVSDNVAPFVDRIFEAPEAFGVAGAWLGAAFFSVQIYCDFSGYSDMAIASAGLLGYRLPENFDFPYLATNLQDFWRRWHMTLSFWLRDYLYVPLGGNREGQGRAYLNLMITMLAAGLWHGAGWTFVLFGAIHGAGLCVCRFWKRAHGTVGRRSGPFGALLTLLVVVQAFVVFRAPDLAAAGRLMSIQFGLAPGGSRTVGAGPLVLLGLLAVLHVASRSGILQRRAERLPSWVFSLAWGATVACVLAFANSSVRPFIYFQF